MPPGQVNLSWLQRKSRNMRMRTLALPLAAALLMACVGSSVGYLAPLNLPGKLGILEAEKSKAALGARSSRSACRPLLATLRSSSEGGASEAEAGKGKSKGTRARAASLLVAASVILAPIKGANAQVASKRPASLSQRINKVSWAVEDRMLDARDVIEDAVLDTCKFTSLALSNSGGRKIAAAATMVGAGGAGAIVLGRSLDGFQKRVVMTDGGDREEEVVEGEGSADELRMKRRLDMLKKIDAKVESKGLSSLSANEFQMMHEELRDMVKYGDEAVFQMSEEDVQTKTLERRKAREEKRSKRAELFERNAELTKKIQENMKENTQRPDRRGGMDFE